jgi:hypothetical protein
METTTMEMEGLRIELGNREEVDGSKEPERREREEAPQLQLSVVGNTNRYLYKEKRCC